MREKKKQSTLELKLNFQEEIGPAEQMLEEWEKEDILDHGKDPKFFSLSTLYKYAEL